MTHNAKRSNHADSGTDTTSCLNPQFSELSSRSPKGGRGQGVGCSSQGP